LRSHDSKVVELVVCLSTDEKSRPSLHCTIKDFKIHCASTFTWYPGRLVKINSQPI
jgi:hypothetical protein